MLPGIVAFLAFFTMGAVVVFGFMSAERTNKRLHQPTRPSTLAADAPSTLPPGQKPVDT